VSDRTPKPGPIRNGEYRLEKHRQTLKAWTVTGPLRSPPGTGAEVFPSTSRGVGDGVAASTPGCGHAPRPARRAILPDPFDPLARFGMSSSATKPGAHACRTADGGRDLNQQIGGGAAPGGAQRGDAATSVPVRQREEDHALSQDGDPRVAAPSQAQSRVDGRTTPRECAGRRSLDQHDQAL
jgi:hypothetical protein